MNGGQAPSLRRQVLGGLFWKFGERILAQGISFAVSVQLARLLLPGEFGVVALTWIFIALANVFVVSGFASALVQKKDAEDIDFSTNFHCSFAVSLVAYGVLFAVAPFIAEFYYDDPADIALLASVLRVMGLRLPVAAFSSIQHAWVERHMVFRKYFFSTLAGTLLSGAVGIGMARCGFGVWALVGQQFTNVVVDVIVLFFTVPWRPRLEFSAPSAKKMMSFGWKVLAADLSGTFFDQLRSLLVGRIFTPAQLAFYNKGKGLPDLLANNINASLMTVLFPAIANINDDLERVRTVLRKSVSHTAWVLFPCLFGLAATARSLVPALYTAKWAESIPCIQILALSTAVSLVGNVGLQAVKAIGRSDVLLKLEFRKKPVYVVLLLLGLVAGRKCGILALVAWSMLVYAIYGTIVNARPLNKLVGYGYREQLRDLAPAVALSSAMAGVVSLFYLAGCGPVATLAMQVPAGALFYVAASAATKNRSFGELLDMAKRRLGGAASAPAGG